MNKFDDFLTPDNINQFPIYLEVHYKKLLRQELQLLILKNKDTEYFDIDFFRKRNSIDIETMQNILGVIIEELENLGWKWQLCYGNTGLYVFKDKAPDTIW